ncbi:MFS transporter [Providencia huaxiensis]|uniref:MFS transporter n=1 Tax=Providencia huaxiensis TaxID=2027290 RepID=UPI0032DA7090
MTSLFISALTRHLNRKTLLLGLAFLMGLSGAMIALAPNYYVYMVGRALIGVVVGGFWSMSAAIAMRLVPIDQVPKALAIFNSGNALATVIAAPLGAYLGSTIVWLWVSLPSMPTAPNSHQNTPQILSIFSFFKYRVVTLGMLAIGLFFMGQFTLFTYVRPFLETVVKVDISMVTFILLLIGITGFIGTLLINRVLKIGFYQILITIPLLMASIAVSLIFFGYSTLAATVLLSLWGFIATAAPVGWWSWIPRIFSNNTEAGGGVMVAVIQLSIASGASVGGIVFDLMGYESTFAISALFLVVAAILVQCTAKAEKET